MKVMMKFEDVRMPQRESRVSELEIELPNGQKFVLSYDGKGLGVKATGTRRLSSAALAVDPAYGNVVRLRAAKAV